MNRRAFPDKVETRIPELRPFESRSTCIRSSKHSGVTESAVRWSEVGTDVLR